jgi:hypothetical protein
VPIRGRDLEPVIAERGANVGRHRLDGEILVPAPIEGSRCPLKPSAETPEGFAAYVREEIVKWRKVVQAAGIRAE